MDGKNEFVKKKINKNIIFTILFYLIIFSTLLIGILKFNCTTDGNFNFEIKKCIDFSKGIGIYNKCLINFNSNTYRNNIDNDNYVIIYCRYICFKYCQMCNYMHVYIYIYVYICV